MCAGHSDRQWRSGHAKPFALRTGAGTARPTRCAGQGSGVGRCVAGVEPQRRFQPLPPQRIGRPRRDQGRPGGTPLTQGHADVAEFGIGTGLGGRQGLCRREFGQRRIRGGRRRREVPGEQGLCRRVAWLSADRRSAQPAARQQHHAERGPQGESTKKRAVGGHGLPDRRDRLAAMPIVIGIIRVFKAPAFSPGQSRSSRAQTASCSRLTGNFATGE